MEAIRSSETSGTTQHTTRRHIPEEDTLQDREGLIMGGENQKSNAECSVKRNCSKQVLNFNILLENPPPMPCNSFKNISDNRQKILEIETM
jgi:hypothetical protein